MFLVSSCSCLTQSIEASQVLSREWRCNWSSADRQCFNHIWVMNHFIAYWGASYVRSLMVLKHLKSQQLPNVIPAYVWHRHWKDVVNNVLQTDNRVNSNKWFSKYYYFSRFAHWNCIDFIYIYIIYSHIITCTIQEMSNGKKACTIDYASTLQIETANWHQVDRSTSFHSTTAHIVNQQGDFIIWEIWHRGDTITYIE